MFSALLGWIETLANGHLTFLAWDVHAAALSVLMVFVCLPVLKKIFSSLTVNRDVAWVSYWVCPICGQLNHRSFAACRRCEKFRKIPHWKARIEEVMEGKLKPAAAFLGRLYGGAGWIVFYGTLVLAVLGFRLYSFRQHPTRELLGSAALIFLLMCLLFFRRALRLVPKSPLNFLTDAIAAVMMAAFFLATSVLWAAAPYRTPRSLAIIQTFSADQLRIRVAGKAPIVAQGIKHGGAITWKVEYAVLSWSLFDVHQIFLDRISDQALEDRWLLWLIQQAAPKLQAATRTSPQLILLTQDFTGVPGRSYALAENPLGHGLTLTPSP